MLDRNKNLQVEYCETELAEICKRRPILQKSGNIKFENGSLTFPAIPAKSAEIRRTGRRGVEAGDRRTLAEVSDFAEFCNILAAISPTINRFHQRSTDLPLFFAAFRPD